MSMAPVEIAGVFARLIEVAREYGRLTGQQHIAYASHFGLRGEVVTTLRKGDYGDELEHGEIPALAFRDMAAAVAAYVAAKEAERARNEAQSEEWERGQYLRLKAKYERES